MRVADDRAHPRAGPSSGGHDMLNENDKEISLTFAKGLSVIRAFEGKNRALSIPEISAKVQLNRAVTRRLIRTLERLGYVSFDRGRYELTPRILRLTQGFIEGRNISQIIQPILRQTSHEIGESVSFAMLDEHDAVYVAHSFVPSKFTLNMVTVGSRAPLAPTAVGRAILAFLGDEQKAEIMAGEEFRLYTDKTEINRDRFLEVLKTIRVRGYAFAESEYVEGVSSLALPVHGQSYEIVGAISIIFPTGQYVEADLPPDLLPRLKRCAADIGATF